MVAGPVKLAEVTNIPAPLLLLIGSGGLKRSMVVSKPPIVIRFACAEKASIERVMAEKPVMTDLRKVSGLCIKCSLETVNGICQRLNFYIYTGATNC